ncbi:MAG: hypothetical protein WC679_04365 [Bacteroidales bacterium]|jgi:hypothetical protein
MIDPITTFRILNKDNSIVVDYFESDNGVIKLLVESNYWDLQIVGNLSNELSHMFKKILRIKKEKNIICGYLMVQMKMINMILLIE